MKRNTWALQKNTCGCHRRTNMESKRCHINSSHHGDVIMSAMASQITSLTMVCSTVYSGANQRKHQSSASLAFVQGIHRDRWIPAQKASNAEMFPFDDVIMLNPIMTWINWVRFTTKLNLTNKIPIRAFANRVLPKIIWFAAHCFRGVYYTPRVVQVYSRYRELSSAIIQPFWLTL